MSISTHAPPPSKRSGSSQQRRLGSASLRLLGGIDLDLDVHTHLAISFWDAVDELSDLSLVPRAHFRPIKGRSWSSTVPFQSKASSWPPEFGQLENLQDPHQHFAAAETLLHPLDSVETDFEPDLLAALQKIRKVLHDIPGFKSRRLHGARSLLTTRLSLSSGSHCIATLKEFSRPPTP